VNELSLFSGAGGGLLGTKLLGFKHIGYVEWDDYCQRVIAARIRDGILDDAPIFGNIKTFISSGSASLYRGVTDIITGGFPCQDISCAGSGKGITGERSGLWKEMAQVIRIVRPRFAFVENSPMLTIRGLGTVLRDLAEMGFNARWGVFSAADIGAPHIRERIFILAHAKGERFPADMLAQGPDERKRGEKDKRGRNIQFKRLFGDMGHQAFPPAFNDERWARESQREWPTPCIERGVRGSTERHTERVYRLKSIGNMQVPKVVATAWRILKGEN